MLQRTHTGRPAAVTKAPKTDLCTTLNDAGVPRGRIDAINVRYAELPRVDLWRSARTRA